MAFLIGILLAGVLGVVVLLMTRFPRVTTVIHEYGRVMLISGVLVVVLGVVSGCVLFVDGSETAGSAAMVTGAIVGGLAIAMASAAAAALRIKERTGDATAKVGPPPVFPPFREALFAIRFVFREARSLARVAGPWVLLVFLMYLAVGALLFSAKAQPSLLGPLLLLFFATAVVMVLAAATVATAWMRLVIDGRPPSGLVVLPVRSTWSVFWRLGLAGIVFNGIGRTILPLFEKAPTIPGLDPALLVGIGGDLVLLLVAVGGMPFVGTLPAVAVGDRQLVGLREKILLWGGRYGCGGVLAGIVFLAPVWIADLFLGSLETPPVVLAPMIAVALVLNTLALASVSTYLSRAYLAAKGRLPSQSAE